LISSAVNKKTIWCKDLFDQLSCTSSENSDVESFCPQDGHLPLDDLSTSFRDFNIFMFVIFSPHLPQVISTDNKVIIYAKQLRNDLDFF
jgi:hypothetical protein